MGLLAKYNMLQLDTIRMHGFVILQNSVVNKSLISLMFFAT